MKKSTACQSDRENCSKFTEKQTKPFLLAYFCFVHIFLLIEMCENLRKKVIKFVDKYIFK